MEVRENRLSDVSRVTPGSYLRYIEAGWAWVAETEDGIVGFAAIDAASSSVWALFISPGAQGSGVGRALHRHLLEWARDYGLDHLSLTTEPNSRAARFYERAGWTHAGSSADGEIRFERTF
jgi:GNAT superfamily N-acetyltransferase